MSLELPKDIKPMFLVGNVVDQLRLIPDNVIQCVTTSSPYLWMRRYDACVCSIKKNVSTNHGLIGGNVNEGRGGQYDPNDPRCRKDPDPDCPYCLGSGHIKEVQPQIWGGNPICDHVWGDQIVVRPSAEGIRSVPEGDHREGRKQSAETSDRGQFCERCGSWKGHLGSEPEPLLFVQHLVFDVCREIKRVLRPDGTLWFNIADSSVGSGKAGNNPEYQKRHTEYGKPSVEKSRFGLGGVIPEGYKAKQMALVPELLVLLMHQDGWYLRSRAVWCKPNPSRTSADDRLTRAWEPVYQFTKSDKYYYNEEAVRQPYSESTMKEVGIAYRNPSTKFYERQQAQDPSDAKRSIIETLERRGGSMLTDVWWFPPASYKGQHTATFPESLPELCISASSRPGDIVLDPFMGSGTTLVVARQLGRRSVGIDLNPLFVREAEERIAKATEKLPPKFHAQKKLEQVAEENP